MSSTQRVPGTAIFMSAATRGVPSALLHNIKHNKVLHERVVVLTVKIAEVPYVEPDERIEISRSGPGLLPPGAAITASWKKPTFPPRSSTAEMCGGAVRDDADQLLPLAPDAARAKKPGMAIWRERLFAWMLRNAATPMEFFRLPTNRVVELGSQLEI